MTGDNIEEVVDLLLVVHGDLSVAGVTAHRMVTVLTTNRLLSPAAFLSLQWEGHSLGCVDCTVDDKHSSVLGLVDLMSLAVQAED